MVQMPAMPLGQRKKLSYRPIADIATAVDMRKQHQGSDSLTVTRLSSYYESSPPTIPFGHNVLKWYGTTFEANLRHTILTLGQLKSDDPQVDCRPLTEHLIKLRSST